MAKTKRLNSIQLLNLKISSILDSIDRKERQILKLKEEHKSFLKAVKLLEEAENQSNSESESDKGIDPEIA